LADKVTKGARTKGDLGMHIQAKHRKTNRSKGNEASSLATKAEACFVPLPRKEKEFDKETPGIPSSVC
jgi:hypothetical protein